MQMGIKFLLVLNIAGFSYFSSAEELSLEQQDALDSLMELLVTDIATKTRPLDPDLAPGTVLVLTGERLRTLGVQKVGDALNLIPGVSYQGLFTSPIVRGVGGALSFASGKIKYQLNGKAVNETNNATDASILGLRIEAIDRIEVIRGPGSAVHGEFALSAVVDVITRKDKNINFGGGSGKNRNIQVSFQHELTGGGLVTLSSGHERQNGQRVISGPDLGSSFDPASSNAPGPVFEPLDNKYLIFEATKNEYSFSFQLLDSGEGVYFGTNNFLVDNPNDIILTQRTAQTQLSADYELNSTQELSVYIGAKQFDRKFRDHRGFPKNFLNIYPNGTFADSTERQYTANTGVDFTWFQSDRSTTSIGVAYENIKSDEASILTNQDLDNNIPFVGLPVPLVTPRTFPIGYEGRTRNITTAHFQQEAAIGNRLNLTLGVRYDDYSDVGNNYSPRLAAVFQANDQNIFKASIGEAFRPPTFVELYNLTRFLQGNPQTRPETVLTSEVSYINKFARGRIELTLFRASYDDVIVLQNLGPVSSQYINSGGFTSKGGEFDALYKVSDALTIGGNYSYAEAHDDITNEDFAGTGRSLANAYSIVEINPNLSLSFRYEYVGHRNRNRNDNPLLTDTRSSLEGYETFSLTAIQKNIILGGDISLTINNMFDEDIKQPAIQNTYPEDFPRAGRGFSLNYSIDY